MSNQDAPTYPIASPTTGAAACIAVQDLLSAPASSVDVAGPRPLWQRSMGRIVLSWALMASVIGPALGHSGTSASSITPVPTAPLAISAVPEGIFRGEISLPSGRGKVAVYDLGAMESVDGEDKEAFLRRVGIALETYAKATAMEACARICQAPSQPRFAVQLTTNHAHVACAITNLCPAGYEPTDDSIHVHPVGQQFRYTQADEDLSGGRYRKNRKGCAVHSHFSKTDLSAGPGYLVGDGTLQYHDGAKQVLRLGDLGTPDLVDIPWLRETLLDTTDAVAQVTPRIAP